MSSSMYLCLPVLILLVFISSSQGQGLSFSPCVSNSDCQGNRRCLEFTFQFFRACQDNGQYCACVPDDIFEVICNASSDCEDGETCTDRLIKLLGDSLSLEIDSICTDNSQMPFLENPQKCETDSDCSMDSTCFTIDAFSYCVASINGLSKEPPISGNDTSVAGNGSSTESENNPNGENDTLQESVSPESSTGGGDACISSQALSHLPKALLKYAEHRKARVLCDSNMSCATPGHLVTFQGQTMMMLSYCRMVECTREVMDVNSPLFQRGLRIKSNTNDLEFLAFAARYGSAVEEKLFKTAVWLGF